jgi:hypothetical protein
MVDPTPNEIAAMQAGGAQGGEYLESIGKTDLAALDQGEYQTFVEAVISGYCDHLRELNTKDNTTLHSMETVPA